MYKRARRAEQKAERRAEILMTARTLCHEEGILNWSLNELGRRADVNKSNLYRYFSNREEILMTLMAEETGRFVTLFKQATAGKTLTVKELAKVIAQQYGQQIFLCDLLSLSSTLFEHKVNLERMRDIKLISMPQMQDIAGAISSCLGGIDEDMAGQIAFTSGVMVAGLWPMTHPDAPMRKLAQFDGLEVLNIEFEMQMTVMMTAYITGIIANQSSP